MNNVETEQQLMFCVYFWLTSIVFPSSFEEELEPPTNVHLEKSHPFPAQWML